MCFHTHLCRTIVLRSRDLWYDQCYLNGCLCILKQWSDLCWLILFCLNFVLLENVIKKGKFVRFHDNDNFEDYFYYWRVFVNKIDLYNDTSLYQDNMMIPVFIRKFPHALLQFPLKRPVQHSKEYRCLC